MFFFLLKLAENGKCRYSLEPPHGGGAVLTTIHNVRIFMIRYRKKNKMNNSINPSFELNNFNGYKC